MLLLSKDKSEVSAPPETDKLMSEVPTIEKAVKALPPVVAFWTDAFNWVDCKINPAAASAVVSP